MLAGYNEKNLLPVCVDRGLGLCIRLSEMLAGYNEKNALPVFVERVVL